ncbi:hypothetical protein G7Z17_g4472 [Cylindrodendrum hubeiense]|uniref:Agmatinase n=1 Tax=Cylindrodendrum hubeiense TaxID=595255 RepID=A0A9P5HCQ1_9HYPO|nr:hypothetical protein G7Z17_g4472 [Cylindrodendrum hubeiense]
MYFACLSRRTFLEPFSDIWSLIYPEFSADVVVESDACLALLAVASLSNQLLGAIAYVPKPPRDQIKLGNEPQEAQTFHQTSIYRPPDDYSLMGSRPNAPQEFHMYDNFGKDSPMPGIATFAHIDWTNCFVPENDGSFDIGIVGMPFDLGVSYRPGQRFGPAATRTAAQRMAPFISWSMAHGMVNPFLDWATVVDCGDIPNSVFDKYEAVQELGAGLHSMASRKPKDTVKGDKVRLITLGGDHTITLPSLRALYPVWGEMAVIHFDSHLDTWNPAQWGGGLNNIHVGTRAVLFDKNEDLRHDAECGFQCIMATDVDTIGINAIVERIVERVGNNPVYVTIDIDVLDPATGTTEIGGWSTRELVAVLRGLSNAGVLIIGADVAELSPVYDDASQTTATAVAQLVFELLQWMVKVPYN